MSGGTVFISYRRSDTKYSVGRLFDHLVLINGLPRETVFLDIDIRYGELFPDVLAETLEKTDVLLAVIGKRWFGENAESRFIDTIDFVRMEIESALKKAIPIIPVLMEEGSVPAARDLPPSMQKVVNYHACNIRHESFADLEDRPWPSSTCDRTANAATRTFRHRAGRRSSAPTNARSAATASKAC